MSRVCAAVFFAATSLIGRQGTNKPSERTVDQQVKQAETSRSETKTTIEAPQPVVGAIALKYEEALKAANKAKAVVDAANKKLEDLRDALVARTSGGKTDTKKTADQIEKLEADLVGQKAEAEQTKAEADRLLKVLVGAAKEANETKGKESAVLMAEKAAAEHDTKKADQALTKAENSLKQAEDSLKQAEEKEKNTPPPRTLEEESKLKNAVAEAIVKVEKARQNVDEGKKLAESTQRTADIKGAALNATVDENTLPYWVSLFLTTGTRDIGKSASGQSAPRADGFSIDFGGKRPLLFDSKEPKKKATSYWLVTGYATLFSTDPAVVSSVANGPVTTQTTTQTTYEARWNFEGSVRWMPWWLKDQTVGIGGILSLGRTSYDTNKITTTATEAGVLTTSNPIDKVRIQATVVRAAARFELTPGSANPWQGSFLELGWLRDPYYLERKDRAYVQAHLAFPSSDATGANGAFIEMKLVTGHGQKDELGFIIGYKAKLSFLSSAISKKP